MSTIFPLSASAGQVFNGYTFDGTSWNINGIDLNENYLEESSASATYLTQVSASATYLTQASASTTYQVKVANIDDTEIGYLNNASANIQTQLNAKANLSGATFSNNIIAPEVRATTKLVGQTVGGDEGGEILLGKAATNTTLTGDGVTIDVWQNRLRIFEQGGNARGGYFDVSTLANGVTTNLTPGLAKMIPTSVTVGSGSASVSTAGTVTFSGATHVQINGCFTSAYENYQILINPTGSAGSLTQITLSVNGTQITSATGYSNTFTYNQYGSTAVAGLSNNATSAWVISAVNTDNTQSQIIDLFGPQTTKGKTGRFFANYIGTYVAMGGIRNPITTSCDGFRYAPQSGNVSGTITVYGYNN